jgi:titin
VAAFNSNGQSSQSSSASATTQSSGGGGTRPNAPTGVTATALSATAIRISWNAVSGATGYRVEGATSASGPWSVYAGFVNPITSTSFDNTGMQPLTRLFFRVIAVNAAGNSNPSATVNATTHNAPPNTPFGSPVASNITRNSMTVTWNASIRAEGYELERATNASGPWTQVFRGTTASPPSRNVTGLAANTTYFFRVRAYTTGTGGGNSAWSNVSQGFRTSP